MGTIMSKTKKNNNTIKEKENKKTKPSKKLKHKKSKKATSNSNTLCYLSPKNFSNNYDKHYFTIDMDYESESLETLPHSDDKIHGNKKLPACYYTIEVCSGGSYESNYKIQRRYSEFEWLRNELSSSNKNNKALRTLPPKTYFSCRGPTEEFIDDRQKELFEFLDDALNVSTNVQHPAMRRFLMLDKLDGGGDIVVGPIGKEKGKKKKEEYDEPKGEEEDDGDDDDDDNDSVEDVTHKAKARK